MAVAFVVVVVVVAALVARAGAHERARVARGAAVELARKIVELARDVVVPSKGKVSSRKGHLILQLCWAFHMTQPRPTARSSSESSESESSSPPESTTVFPHALAIAKKLFSIPLLLILSGIFTSRSMSCSTSFFLVLSSLQYFKFNSFSS